MSRHHTLSRGERAAYPYAEVSTYVKVAPATLRSWVAGRNYPTTSGARRFSPLISAADPKKKLLSFNNLVEAHVLRALRSTHGTSISAIRTALRYAEAELGIERLLLSRELCTDKRDLFLDRYGELINLSRSGQFAMRAVLQQHLERIEWDSAIYPVRLYPFVPGEKPQTSRLIAIDPEIGFGRPVVRARGVSTRVIVERIDAGEELADVAADYDLDISAVEEAVLYERAA